MLKYFPAYMGNLTFAQLREVLTSILLKGALKCCVYSLSPFKP